MATQTVTVGSAQGLHARPAAIVAQAAAAAGSPVLIGRVGESAVDASSVLMLMTQGIGAGEEVEISSDDENALATVAGLVASDLDAS